MKFDLKMTVATGVLIVVLGSLSSARAAGQSSPSYRVSADVLARGGAAWAVSSSGTYTMAGTLGQQTAGNSQTSGAYILIPGYQSAMIGIITGGGTSDQDGDGLPDWWEELYFGGATNAVPGTDSDLDGHPNGSEFIAGTNPTNALSVFGLGRVSLTTTNQWIVVRWNSVTGKAYDIEKATNLVSGFWPLTNGILATPPENVYTDSIAPLPNCLFYRIKTGP